MQNDKNYKLIEIPDQDNVPAIEIEVIYNHEEWHLLSQIDENIKNAVVSIFRRLDHSSQNTLNICLLLSDDQEIRQLNKTYRDKDKPTNVLSFPNIEEHDAEGNHILGDVAFSFSTLSSEAKELNVELMSHFLHLLVHGILHVLGYDHQNIDDEQVMEKMEQDILSDIGIILE